MEERLAGGWIALTDPKPVVLPTHDPDTVKKVNEAGRVPLDAGVKKAMERGLEKAIKDGSLPEDAILSKVQYARMMQARRALKVACPESLEKLAHRNAKDLDMEVDFYFDYREDAWVVRMTTARGMVEALPELPDPANIMVERLIDKAWRNALAELGLLR